MNYVAKHRGGYRYQRKIPVDVAPALGKAWWKVFLSDTGRETVQATARQMASEHDRVIAAVRGLTGEQRTDAAALGGLERREALARSVASGAVARTAVARLDPNRYPANAGRLALAKHNALDALAQIEADEVPTLARLDAVALQVQDDASHRMMALWQLWVTNTGSQCIDDHKRTAALFIRLVGDMDYRAVTGEHVGAFRDALATDVDGKGEPRSPKNQSRQLERLGAMFSAAVSERKIKADAHPCKGVRVRGKGARKAVVIKQAFTGAETDRILAHARATKFGGDKHEAVMMALELMAWTGARPSEALQVQGGDVVTVAGIDCVHIRPTDAVTGKAYVVVPGSKPLKSIKNDESPRLVPLHSAIAEKFKTFAAGDAGRFVFDDAFTFNRQKGRYHWFGMHFGAFLAECGVVAKDDAHEVALYSFRHGFKAAMERARITEDNRKRIMGHSGGIHGGYGDDNVKALAADIARVDVLSD